MARTKGEPRKTTTSSHTSIRTIGHMQAMAGGHYNDHLRTKAHLATQKRNETEEAEVELMLTLSDAEEADVVARVNFDKEMEVVVEVEETVVEDEDEDEEEDEEDDEDVEMEEDDSEMEETDEEEEEEEYINVDDDDVEMEDEDVNRAVLLLVRDIVHDMPNTFVDEDAMSCLQDLARRFLDRFFDNAVVSMQYGRCNTLMVGDVRHAVVYNNPDMTHDYIQDIIAHDYGESNTTTFCGMYKRLSLIDLGATLI
ncbi:hypothetical protein AGABI2DRAFT_144457 [Agaricus bisporus var. bisporus H97]|uniref:hypothetical protein n=1 Tax=Agaricus bisporus var. bisporus (strain H97 / ATCC MYA-4626 / FGSC 10389) TaxID=936046 RepID=UPI00029F6FE0|nr:hypothetical protein AGABI2DRAFT_144457 [Agaricus bisporus var. bisporus H97]EKV44900.1 hypothetical protein AGABI2DRAFT_144457 [Agaricus bisporus var. bisporus H97]